MTRIISGTLNKIAGLVRPQVLDKQYFLKELKKISDDQISTESKAELRSELIYKFGKEEKSKEVLIWLSELALNKEEKNIEYKRHAVLCLNYFHHRNEKEVETYLAKCLEDKSPVIRGAAINRIGYLESYIDHKQFIPLLIKHLDDKDSDVRRASAKALGELSGPEALKALEAKYNDPKSSNKNSLLWALWKIDVHIYHEVKGDFHSGLVDGPEEDMRARNKEIINENIGKYGKERFLSALAKIACNQDEGCEDRYRAMSCLEQIGGPEALTALTDKLRNGYKRR